MQPSPSAAERLLLAFDLYEAGEEMMRARLARERPDADSEEIERRISEWLQGDDGEGPPEGFRRRPLA
ncbi:MAG: hypothetical protein R2991_00990 [Thermoanaerobaculia bacterium]